jgi:predicted transposase YbfD/YdcC
MFFSKNNFQLLEKINSNLLRFFNSLLKNRCLIIMKPSTYYIGWIDHNAEQFACAIRRRWAVENSLHWALDASFREDDSRVRKGHSPENLAALRHAALNRTKKRRR